MWDGFPAQLKELNDFAVLVCVPALWPDFCEFRGEGKDRWWGWLRVGKAEGSMKTHGSLACSMTTKVFFARWAVNLCEFSCGLARRAYANVPLPSVAELLACLLPSKTAR